MIRSTTEKPPPPASFRGEYQLLEGPKSRLAELWSVLRIVREFIRGFRTFHFVGPCITFFGSARFPADHDFYQKARGMAGEIARMGFTIMTGGGGGIMEAANRGAREAGGRSVGCNIRLPQEQAPNRFMDLHLTLDHFYVRKVILTKYSCGFVIMPGGSGTLDEFFEIFTLIQTGKIQRFPVVLFGRRYWNNLLSQIEFMKEQQTLSPEDTELFLTTDDPGEALDHIRLYASAYRQRAYPRAPRRRWWLGE